MILAAAVFALLSSNLDSRAAVAFAKGDFAAAESWWREALAIETSSAAGDNARRAEIELDLAAVLRARARYAEAERRYADVLKTAGGSITPQADLGMARLELDRGRLDEAMALLTDAKLESAEAVLLRATIWFRKGDPGKAADNANSALHRLEADHRDESMTYAEALNLLGVISSTLGDFKAAESYDRRSFALINRIAGPDHPEGATALNNLGEVESARGNWKDAEVDFERASEIWRRAYGEEHPDVASALANLAALYRKLHKYDRAAPLLDRALAIDRAVLGPDNGKVALDLNNLGALAMARHRYPEAEALFARALAINEQAQGPRGADTGLDAGNLATAYMADRRYGDSAPLYLRAIQIREREFGARDPKLCALLELYANVLRKTEDFAGAEEAEAHAMKICVRNAMAPTASPSQGRAPQ